MAHRHPNLPLFTQWVCQKGILREPFRLVDVGVRGGLQDHWLFFGDHLQAWGFDPLLEEGVGPLIASNPAPDRIHYFNVGLGESDGVREFHFVRDNPSSSFFGAAEETGEFELLQVQMRSLDSLYSDGTLRSVDFMKMDTEGHEIEVLKGGSDFLRHSGIFGVESETILFRTEKHPRSQFVELHEQLSKYGYNIYDIGVQRSPRPALACGFPAHMGNGRYKLVPTGQQHVLDTLFLSAAYEQTEVQAQYEIDRLIKIVATAELYGLPDVALEILFSNKNRLGSRLDVEEAANWLVRERPDSDLTYRQYRSDLIESPTEPDPTVWILPENPAIAEFSYEGAGDTTSIIPRDPAKVTPTHGAAILRISPKLPAGTTRLHFHLCINCYSSQPDTAVVSLFQDGKNAPAALLTQALEPNSLTVLREDVVIPVENSGTPPVFDIRVGLASVGGRLYINRDPVHETQAPTPSYVRIQSQK